MFEIEPMTGEITLIKPPVGMEDTENGQYDLVVRVTGLGKTPLHSDSKDGEKYQMEDINNKPLVFHKELYTAYVLEKESQGYQVLTITANDRDRNVDLEYDITEPIIARDKSGTELDNVAGFNFKAALTIDPQTGEILLNQKLSYSSVAVIIRTRQVVDRNSEKGREEQMATAILTLGC